MKSIEYDSGGPVMPEIEVARDGQIADERRILEVAHPLRADARVGQPVVEIRGRAIAEVVTDSSLYRRQDLQQDEDDADDRERDDERIARCTAATSTPIAMAKSAGRMPRSSTTPTRRRQGGRRLSAELRRTAIPYAGADAGAY